MAWNRRHTKENQTHGGFYWALRNARCPKNIHREIKVYIWSSVTSEKGVWSDWRSFPLCLRCLSSCFYLTVQRKYEQAFIWMWWEGMSRTALNKNSVWEPWKQCREKVWETGLHCDIGSRYDIIGHGVMELASCRMRCSVQLWYFQATQEKQNQGWSRAFKNLIWTVSGSHGSTVTHPKIRNFPLDMVLQLQVMSHSNYEIPSEVMRL